MRHGPARTDLPSAGVRPAERSVTPPVVAEPEQVARVVDRVQHAVAAGEHARVGPAAAHFHETLPRPAEAAVLPAVVVVPEQVAGVRDGVDHAVAAREQVTEAPGHLQRDLRTGARHGDRDGGIGKLEGRPGSGDGRADEHGARVRSVTTRHVGDERHLRAAGRDAPIPARARSRLQEEAPTRSEAVGPRHDDAGRAGRGGAGERMQGDGRLGARTEAQVDGYRVVVQVEPAAGAQHRGGHPRSGRAERRVRVRELLALASHDAEGVAVLDVAEAGAEESVSGAGEVAQFMAEQGLAEVLGGEVEVAVGGVVGPPRG